MYDFPLVDRCINNGSIFHAFLYPYLLEVLSYDGSSRSHVTCFGQWDNSKIDTGETQKCSYAFLVLLNPCNHHVNVTRLACWGMWETHREEPRCLSNTYLHTCSCVQVAKSSAQIISLQTHEPYMLTILLSLWLFVLGILCGNGCLTILPHILVFVLAHMMSNNSFLSLKIC